jgi:hypothetical protein
MKRIALFFALLSEVSAFAGGSNPGLYYGKTPTSAQWNSYFSAKLDYTPGSANTIPYWDGAGSLLNAPVSGDCSSAANVFTCTIGGAGIHAAPIKSIPVGADEYPIWNSATGVLNKVTFTDSLSWYAAKNGNAANTFSVAPATAAAHATQMAQFDGAAGHVGEVISSFSGVVNFPTTNTYGDLTSITLPAGRWMIECTATVVAAGATVSLGVIGISATAGNSSTGLVSGDNQIELTPPTGVISPGGSISPYLVTPAVSTIYYLKFLALYTVATPNARGRITAVRIGL